MTKLNTIIKKSHLRPWYFWLFISLDHKQLVELLLQWFLRVIAAWRQGIGCLLIVETRIIWIHNPFFSSLKNCFFLFLFDRTLALTEQVRYWTCFLFLQKPWSLGWERGVHLILEAYSSLDSLKFWVVTNRPFIFLFFNLSKDFILSLFSSNFGWNSFLFASAGSDLEIVSRSIVWVFFCLIFEPRLFCSKVSLYVWFFL